MTQIHVNSVLETQHLVLFYNVTKVQAAKMRYVLKKKLKRTREQHVYIEEFLSFRGISKERFETVTRIKLVS